jgi:REP element-mobilizing transposase RayT
MSRPGWHHREYLPHYDGPDAAQHIIFRLADSLPSSVMDSFERLVREERTREIDRHLDIGHGEVLLREPDAAQIVATALGHFDGLRYALHAWCVMPNHVHVVVTPMGEHKLGEIVGGWKSFTAKEINKLLNRSGRFWAADYFDRFMRNEEQFQTTVAYVENNPVAAALCTTPQQWPFSSASERAGGTPALR